MSVLADLGSCIAAMHQRYERNQGQQLEHEETYEENRRAMMIGPRQALPNYLGGVKAHPG